MVELGVSRRPETGEYRVFWKEDGRDDEAKAYYTDSAFDAVSTLFDISTRNKRAGIPTSISAARTTRALLDKYERFLEGHWGEGD